MMSIKKLINVAKKLGGLTTSENLEVINKNTGYQVAFKTFDIVGLQEKRKIKKAIKTAKKEAKKENADIGLWIDENMLYIELSKNVKTKSQAIEDGKKLNQICIYDWENKDVLYC